MSKSGETPGVVPVDHADELRADIINTRAELADTIDRLKAKLDVKARARHQVDEARSAARERLEKAPVPVQHAVKRAEAVLHKARPYRKQVAIATVGALLVTVVARRLSR